MKHSIKIAQNGTEFQVGKTDARVILKDDNCIWRGNSIYFTEVGWHKYKQRLEDLPNKIDQMRVL